MSWYIHTFCNVQSGKYVYIQKHLAFLHEENIKIPIFPCFRLEKCTVWRRRVDWISEEWRGKNWHLGEEIRPGKDTTEAIIWKWNKDTGSLIWSPFLWRLGEVRWKNTCDEKQGKQIPEYNTGTINTPHHRSKIICYQEWNEEKRNLLMRKN